MSAVITFTEPFKSTAKFYNGVPTAKTATGSGTGTQTATRLIIGSRTASGSGAGSQTATGRNIFVKRTATGSGVGTINVSRTNLLPNPNVEATNTGWGISGGTISQSSTFAYSGTFSSRTQTTVAGAIDTIPASWTPVVGQDYTYSAYVRSSVARQCRLYIGWYNGATLVSQSIGSYVTSSTSAWTRCSVTATAPATATIGYIVTQTVATIIGDLHYWDGFLLETGSTLLPYFDGTYADTYTGYTLTTQAWNGTANASTSTANFIGLTQLTTFKRVGTASAGTGSSAAIRVISRFRTATGSGVGATSGNATRLITRFRTATGSGVGSATAIKAVTKFRAATGSGTGTQYASAIEILPREASGSGLGYTSQDATGYKFHMFRPPTRFDGPTTLVGGDRVANRLARFYRPRERGRNVYQLVDLTFTEVDQANYDVVLKVYHGGHVHELTEGEYTDLLAAGYSAYLT
jgi:hypothetical protein